MKHLKKFNENPFFGSDWNDDDSGRLSHWDDEFEYPESPEKNHDQKWAIYSGLGGGFGGAHFKEVFTGTKEEAEKTAYQLAIEEYESYEGLHGLRTTSDIMEEDEVDEDEAEEIYNQEREDWLDYYVKPYDPTKDYE